MSVSTLTRPIAKFTHPQILSFHYSCSLASSNVFLTRTYARRNFASWRRDICSQTNAFTTSIRKDCQHYSTQSPLHLYKANSTFKPDQRQQYILEEYLNPIFEHVVNKKPLSYKGVYLFGGVGCGKTMMMDLLHSSLNHAATGTAKFSHRTHFSRFMLKFHQMMHQMRQTSNVKDNDIIFGKVLDAMIEPHTKLLCFDEFQVTDIADAMILKRLFEGFFKKDVLVVMTSNRAPIELYQNGINRDNFIPFIHMLEQRLKVVALKDAPDYRLAGLLKDHMYICTGNREQDVKRLKDIFQQMTKGHEPQPDFLITHGRTVAVPLAAHGVMYCTFADLCRAKMSAVDYIAMCDEYHTIIMQDIPKLKPDDLSEIRRFILLVDEIYQHKVQFICSAHAPPRELLQMDEEQKKQTNIDEYFAFDRTVSRLMEMQSEEYTKQLKSK